ncbi:Urea carboxylase [Penicillium maclennaniae]|uniref:Urea carboxylase n=1 Tax=Penicillium maclennaniae TaxID=1343394 RepID=UPI00253FAD74|nr:Urea carboxylase [Penicillium maclennaniae]KAJ5676573.1 Urea carboxylase [Penicillium maclennaniae]
MVGNDEDAAGLECSNQGPTLLFHSSTTVAIVGANAPVSVDGEEKELGMVISIEAGQKLSIGTATSGSRIYIAILGGIEVPKVLNSRSTFAIGHLGGHKGRSLRVGDILPLASVAKKQIPMLKAPVLPIPPLENREWVVGAIPGRTAVRHISHKTGFMSCSMENDPSTTIAIVSVSASVGLVQSGEGKQVVTLVCTPQTSMTAPIPSEIPIVKEVSNAGRLIRCSQAGDRALLLEFGAEDRFMLRQTFHNRNFIEKHRMITIPGFEELTPGVRSLQVRLTAGFSLPEVLDALVAHGISLRMQIPSRLPSRLVQLPLVSNDDSNRKAIARYASTIRASAPYLPNNIEFVQKLNGLDSSDHVENKLYEGTFLVLGLGDVYQGSPCAVPLDPRHQLFGTKYNPSRSFTPQGAVGIAGQYLCIYATDSPGGYQIVGRTVSIWDDFHKPGLGEKAPWLFTLLDQIQFYPVTEEELSLAEAKGNSSDLIKISDVDLDLNEYEKWLEENAADSTTVREKRSQAVHEAEFFNDLLKPYEPAATRPDREFESHEHMAGERVKAPLPGRCFRCAVKEAEEVQAGDPLIWIEFNKMEMKICAPISGRYVKLLVAEGDILGPNDDVAIVQQV